MVRGQIVIRRSVEEVFDFVADERNEPRYNRAMRASEMLTDGPIGAGTRFRAEMVSGKRVLPMMVEFTEFDRPRRLFSVSKMSRMVVRGGLTFEPVEDGTRMSWRWDITANGVLRFLGPVVWFIGWRQERRIWSSLKELLEAEHPVAESAP